MRVMKFRRRMSCPRGLQSTRSFSIGREILPPMSVQGLERKFQARSASYGWSLIV